MELIVALLSIVFFAIARKNLPQAILILIALLPAYLLRATYFSIPTTLLELMIVSILIVSFKKLDPQYFPNKKILYAILAIIITSTIGIFTSSDTSAAFGIWKAYFIEPILLFFVIQNLISSKKLYTEKIFKALGYSAMFISVIAIIQWLTESGIPAPWDIELRVTSVFNYPNAVGLYLGPIATIAALKLFQKKSLFWLNVLFFSSSAIILAQSEAAVIAVLGSIFVFTLFKKPLRKYSIPAAIIIFAAIVLIPTIKEPVISKITLQDYSGQVRLSQWSETFEMLKTKPFFGAGLSGYQEALKPHHKSTHYEIFQYPHNIFLNTLSEIGIFGLLSFIALIVLFLQIIKHDENKLITQKHIAAFALLEMFIHGLVDVPYFKNDPSVITWILFAMICVNNYERK